MSRIGKIPVEIPAGVQVHVDGAAVAVKGPKGELRQALTGGIQARVDGTRLLLERPDDEASSKALHGLYRALCRNMVEGVTKGFEKRLEVVGVSYQASVQGKSLRLQLGFSHPVELAIPAGLQVVTPNVNTVVISGIDRQAVGHFAALARRVQPPEPYKGKGVRYHGEEVVRKAGKSFVGGEK